LQFTEIFELWEADSKIDIANLAVESLNIAMLHGKYYKIYINEKLIHNKLQAQYDTLKVQKFEFYRYGETAETRAKGWKLPECGARMNDRTVEPYVAADSDLVALTLKIGMSKEKLEFLKSIIGQISIRGYQIKNAIEFMKFQNGQ
jgi:hypothetical protein